MVYEAPSVIKSGEQIGIRLALFNNWDQTLEVWNNYLLWKRKILCKRFSSQGRILLHFPFFYQNNINIKLALKLHSGLID